MPDKEAPAPESMLCVGKVVSAHGVAGAVKVASDASSFDFLMPGQELFFGNGKTGGWFKVEDSRRAGRFSVLRLEGVENRDQAEALSGSLVHVSRESLPELDDGEYYWADIIGLDVVTVSGEPLGKVDSIIETGANDVYVVKNADGKETLLPALEWVIIKVDLAEKLMTVDPPEGL